MIWSIRMEEIQLNIIDNLQQITIWNAGKQVNIILNLILKLLIIKGRKFYRSLKDTNKRKVIIKNKFYFKIKTDSRSFVFVIWIQKRFPKDFILMNYLR